MKNSSAPIGVFDSGIGGLTVVRQLIKFLPNEDIIYLGDTARVPYGNKSKTTIIRFSVENTLYLLKFKVKLIIIACNTSSSFALNDIKGNFKIPIMGVIEPGVKKALGLTKTKRIGVIGTNATINSNAYQKRLIDLDASVKVFGQSCPLFVPLVEEGWLNDNITLSIIKEYLTPLKEKGIDALILGCTHYPLLKNSIKRVMGPTVKLIDSGEEVALSVRQLLDALGIACQRKPKASVKFFLTDIPHKFKAIGEKFLGQKLNYIYQAKI